MGWMAVAWAASAGCGPAIEVDDSDGSGTASGSDASSDTSDTVTPRPDTSDPDTTDPDPSTTTVGPDPDPSTTEDRPDPIPGVLGGNYLLVASSVIAPELPFQYLVVIDPTVVDSQQTAEAYPLTLYVNSTDMPRETLEPPIPFDILQTGPDTFAFGFGGRITGETNPITGSDITAAMYFEGAYIAERDFACGKIEGNVSEPLQVDLAGSSFSMLPVVDGLPAPFPLGCE